jgi:hypothetical protein
MSLNPRFVIITMFIAAVCFTMHLTGVSGATAMYPMLAWLALSMLVTLLV